MDLPNGRSTADRALWVNELKRILYAGTPMPIPFWAIPSLIENTGVLSPVAAVAYPSVSRLRDTWAAPCVSFVWR